MQDLYFAAVNSPSATDPKGWICLWISTVTRNPYHCTGLE